MLYPLRVPPHRNLALAAEARGRCLEAVSRGCVWTDCVCTVENGCAVRLLDEGSEVVGAERSARL